MAEGRWYPTLMELGNGDTLAVSGFRETSGFAWDNEVFSSTTHTWSAANWRKLPLYPQLVLLDDGRIFYSGENGTGDNTMGPGIWQPFGDNTFVPVPGLGTLNKRVYGATILLPPAQDQKVMVIGGGAPKDADGTVSDSAVVDLKA